MRAPFVIDFGKLAGGIGVFDEVDLVLVLFHGRVSFDLPGVCRGRLWPTQSDSRGVIPLGVGDFLTEVAAESRGQKW